MSFSNGRPLLHFIENAILLIQKMYLLQIAVSNTVIKNWQTFRRLLGGSRYGPALLGSSGPSLDLGTGPITAVTMCVSLVSQCHLTLVLRSMFLAFVRHASIGSVRFVVFEDLSTPCPQRHLFMLSLHLVLTIVTQCWLCRLGLLPTGFSVCCWMLYHESSPARGSLTAACLICSTLSYIGWTSINVFSISSESQFIDASRIVLPSTWWTAVCVRLTFPVVSACGQPIGVSWSCRDIVAASSDADRSPLQLRWSGTRFQTPFDTQRWASTTSDRH